MAAFREGNYISREAAVDHTSNQYKAVKLDANNKVVLATAATDEILGVLEHPAKLGETVSVALTNGNGTFKVKTGANITKGAYLTTNGSGLAVAATQAAAGAQPTTRVFGRALATSVSGDIVEYEKKDFLF